MTVKDLFDSHGPSRADLEVLERLERHRNAFAAVQPGNRPQAHVRERLLNHLDAMAEVVCEEGHAAPSLEESWQQVDQLEALYWENASPRPGTSRRQPPRATEPATAKPSLRAA